MRKRRELILGLALVLIVTACGKEEKPFQSNQETTPMTADKVKQEGREAALAAAIYMAQEKEQYQKSVEAKLDEFSEKINLLVAKADKIGTDSKARYRDAIEKLNEQTKAAREKLEEIKATSTERWKDLKSGMNDAVEDLKKSYEEAVSRFT